MIQTKKSVVNPMSTSTRARSCKRAKERVEERLGWRIQLVNKPHAVNETTTTDHSSLGLSFPPLPDHTQDKRNKKVRARNHFSPLSGIHFSSFLGTYGGILSPKERGSNHLITPTEKMPQEHLFLAALLHDAADPCDEIGLGAS